MAINVTITVEDITERLLTYDEIELHRADTVGGAYSLDETVSLVAGQYYYVIEDAEGDLNKWYKYRFHKDPSTNSDFSSPFRVDGVTLLRARQAVLERYKCGHVMVNTWSGDATKLRTIDPAMKDASDSVYRDNRGRGTWVRVATGAAAGDERLITGTDVSVGDIVLNNSLKATPAANDEFEWHTVIEPEAMDSAVRRALSRCWYVDRVPVPGVSGADEYALTIPWLVDKDQIHDVRYYPFRSSGVDDGIDRPWGTEGRWWGKRQDGEVITLLIRPTIDSSVVLYLECTRPMPPLWTDASAAPAIATEELIAAVAYDEVLAYLSRPGSGSAEDVQAWKRARQAHATEVHRLLVKNRPKPRHGPPQLAHPPVVPQPFRSRLQ
jgi:hypothetical protein